MNTLFEPKLITLLMAIIFSGVHAQPLRVMKEAGIINPVEEDHFHWEIKKSIAFAKRLIEKN